MNTDAGRDASATARARVRVVRVGGHTVVRELRSCGAIGLRELRDEGDGVLRVALVQTSAILVGGDDVGLDVDVGPGASLVLRDLSATLAHPMARGVPPARQRLRVCVGAGGRAVIAEEPVIVAVDARFVRAVTIDLAQDAQVLHRDTLVLGRHDETGGSARTHTRVTRDGLPLLDDTLDTRHTTAHSPAVLGTARVVAGLALFGAPPGRLPPDAFALSPRDTLLRRLAPSLRGLGDIEDHQHAWSIQGLTLTATPRRGPASPPPRLGRGVRS